MRNLLKSTILATILGTAANADPVTLKFAHFWPTGAGPHADFATQWTEQVTACSGGEISFEFHTAGSQLGNVTKLEEFLRAGLVDVAHGLNHFPRNRFDEATIIDTPLLAKSAYANSNTLWSLFEEELISEPYDGLKVLALHAHNAGLIHTNSTAVTTPADLEGLRIRAPSPAVGMMLEELGAVPVGVPPGETYEVLSKGTADGTIFPWEGVAAFKLAEVLDYSSDLRLNAASFWFAMNEGSYEGLSDSQRTCVDDASYRPLVNEFGAYWDAWDEPGKAQTEAAENEVIVPSEDQMAEWTAAIAPVVTKYHDALREGGFANVDEAYARAQELVTQFEAEYQASN